MRTLAPLTLLLLSCATGYRPADSASRGYFSMVHGDGTVVVQYQGNEHTSLNDAQRYAFCRAAEVMHSLRYERFVVVDQKFGDPDPATVTTCGWWWVFWGRCVTERVGAPTVNLIVRPAGADATGLSYASSETSSCRTAQTESDRQ